MDEQLIEFAKVLIEWGFWFIVYGAVAMCIGFIIMFLVVNIYCATARK